MNFGDILDQYDKLQKQEKNKNKLNSYNQKSHKKANAPTKEEKEAMAQGYSYQKQMELLMEKESKQRINPMELYLSRYGVVDKDKISQEAEEKRKLNDIDYLKSLRPQATIDLHQLTRDEAWTRLDQFVGDCYRRGLKKILIIHGKGNHSNGSDPVLGPMVRLFIEQDKRLGLSGHPDRNNGGSGATWVLIR